MIENEHAQKIIDAAIEVHRILGGPGLLENIYESALSHELNLRGMVNQRQVPIPVLYKNETIREPLFLDILVDKKLIIEVKANEKDFPFYKTQLLTYLRLTGIKHGLVINFGKKQIKEGISYIVHP